MCVSTAAADFTGTIVHGGRRHHPVHGLIEVLGYQNTAHNLADGPNALVLHLAGAVTPERFIPVGRHTTVLTDMVVGLSARQRAADDVHWMDGAPQVAVFDHDIYTAVDSHTDDARTAGAWSSGTTATSGTSSARSCRTR